MARPVSEIQNDILLSISQNEVLSGQLTSTSATAVFRLFTYIVALAIYTLEFLFDNHKSEVTAIIRENKPGTLPWHRTMALLFQFGFSLVPDRDYYDNSNADPEAVEASKVIKYAAVGEASESSRVILKIAGEAPDGSLAPILEQQRLSFEDYVKEWKIAGVKVTIINYLPDMLYLSIQIKIDPQVLAVNGMSILNGNYPVKDAIAAYMKELPFNGELRLSHLVDKLQVVEGVLDATILSAHSAWINPETSGYGNPASIAIAVIPESGYFEVANYDNLTYVV